MQRLKRSQDAFGRGLLDHHRGGEAYEIVEREDGYVDAIGSGAYFAEFPDWPPHQKRAIALARGRVLDVGCGAGRVALHLQRRGLEVVGIDQSPLAVKVCRLRGVKDARVVSITEASRRRLGQFDTIVMFGNNFGLFASFRRARWLLRRFQSMTSPGARIIAETHDIYQTTNPVHLAYQRTNRRRGRMSGQIRLRIRYERLVTPYIDYLMVSKAELRRIAAGTGWKVTRVFDSPSSSYIAVLEKERL